MNEIEIGQILWFKIRFNNNNDVSEKSHPYVIYKIDKSNDILEVIQINSIKNNNRWRLFYYRSKTSNLSPTYIIPVDNPDEKVINRDSFAQLDNRFLIEHFSGIEKFRKHCEKLSENKLKNLFDKYKEYHEKELIDENKQVYISKDEFEKLNK